MLSDQTRYELRRLHLDAMQLNHQGAPYPITHLLCGICGVDTDRLLPVRVEIRSEVENLTEVCVTCHARNADGEPQYDPGHNPKFSYRYDKIDERHKS